MIKKGTPDISWLGGLIPYRSIPVLVYHHVTETEREDIRAFSISPGRFLSQMRYLKKKGYASISLDELANIEMGGESGAGPGPKIKSPKTKKLFAISFDDGYLDNYTNAFPVLKLFGFKATVFLATGFVGKKTQPIGSCAPSAHMDWPQAKEMQRHGMSFQSHTCTHPDMTKIGVEQINRELNESRKEIEAHLGAPVRHFAYPYGRFNERVMERVKEAGYAWSYAAGASERSSFARERFDVDTEDPPVLFRFMASGYGSWVRTVRNGFLRKRF